MLYSTCCGTTLHPAPTYGALHFSKTVLTLGDGGVSAKRSQNSVNIPSGLYGSHALVVQSASRGSTSNQVSPAVGQTGGPVGVRLDYPKGMKSLCHCKHV